MAKDEPKIEDAKATAPSGAEPLKGGAKQRVTLEKKADGTLAITIVVPSSEVEKSRKLVVDDLVKQVQLPGFRKGAAPRDLAEKKLNHQSVDEEVLKKVISAE